MTSSNINFFRVTGPLWGESTGHRWIPSDSPHKGQWRGALMFPLICAWTNGWPNSRYAGDLRRHRAHYDVTVLIYLVDILPRGRRRTVYFTWHGCRWPDDGRGQGSSSHFINLLLPTYSGFLCASADELPSDTIAIPCMAIYQFFPCFYQIFNLCEKWKII